uniref:Ubiquitin thioesterase OTU n=1 Tax=Lotharella globosa TaxID=91324 RepID=A0A7S3YHH8_9EUKA
MSGRGQGPPGGGGLSGNQDPRDGVTKARELQLLLLMQRLRAANASQQQKKPRELTAEEKKWRDGLKPGDEVDAKDAFGRWTYSHVSEVTDKRIQVLSMETLTNQWYDKYSPNLAQKGKGGQTSVDRFGLDSGIWNPPEDLSNGGGFGLGEKSSPKREDQQADGKTGKTTKPDAESSEDNPFASIFGSPLNSAATPELGKLEGLFGADDNVGTEVAPPKDQKEKSNEKKTKSVANASTQSEAPPADAKTGKKEGSGVVGDGKKSKTTGEGASVGEGKWRKHLEKGSLVDVFYNRSFTMGFWTIAEIAKVTETNVSIRYLQLGEEYDETILLSSNRLAEYGTKTIDATNPAAPPEDTPASALSPLAGTTAASSIPSANPQRGFHYGKIRKTGAGSRTAMAAATGGVVPSKAGKSPHACPGCGDPNCPSKKGGSSGTAQLDRYIAAANLLKLIGAAGGSSVMGTDGASMSAVQKQLEEVIPDAKLSDKERKWRFGIAKGDMVDAIDQEGLWYLCEVTDVEYVKEGKTNPEDRLTLRFVEWGEEWNFKTARHSSLIAEAFTKAKSRKEQDFRHGHAELNPADYSNVKTDRKETCVSLKPCPMPVSREDGGRFIRVRMPGDNSCLFHCFTFACEGRAPATWENAMVHRKRVADMVNADPTFVKNTGFLKEDYCRMIMRRDRWGGAVELAALADFFEIEIVAFDIKGPVAYQFRLPLCS